MNEVFDYLNGLLKDLDCVVLGCSGGPDSMCLLDILQRVGKEKNIKIVVCHVNHNVRRESAKEYLFLKDYCLKNDIVFEGMKIERYGDDNFHNEARNIRYNFFDSIVKKYGANYLMTAHHGDDLIETILMRIVRGSTISGYGGFLVVVDKDNYKLVRPLTFVKKEDILEYNKAKKIPYVIDKSNFKSKYTRNRYRKVVLPFLKSEDSNAHRKFLKFSNILFKYDSYVKKMADGEIKKVMDEDVLLIDKMLELDELILDKVLYSVLEKYYQDDLILISDVHVNLIKSLIYSKKANSFVYLPNSIKVVKSYNKLIIDRVTDLDCSYEIEISDYVHLPNNRVISRIESSDINNNNYCRLSIDGNNSIKLPLTVRTRRSGDKILLKGSGKHKKVKDIFIDAKIPALDRDLWPVVVDASDNIVWIPGLKKSQFDIGKNKKCDIILWYH